MIGREFLKGSDYNTLLHISRRIGDAAYAEAADAAVDMGQGGEMQIALFAAMDFLVQHDIPVSYEDYQFLESEFSQEDDDPDLYPKHYYRVADDEAEVFKKLKLADV